MVQGVPKTRWCRGFLKLDGAGEFLKLYSAGGSEN